MKKKSQKRQHRPESKETNKRPRTGSHTPNHVRNSDEHHHGNTSNIKIAFLLNFCFTIIEIIGGYLTNSVAILSDAIHDLGDTLSLGLALFLEKFSQKKRDHRFSYGYKRFSLLSAIINGIVMIGGSVLILLETIPRLINPEPSNAAGMIALALIGILFNGLGALRLRKGHTMNEQILTWHLVEDIFGWVAILIAGVVMIFITIPILDPILAIIFTLFTLWNVMRISKKTLMIFLQSVPGGVNARQIEKEIESVSGIQSVHDTHIWSMDGQYHVLTTHVVINDKTPDRDIINVKQKVRRVTENHKIKHATIEVERKGEMCSLKEC